MPALVAAVRYLTILPVRWRPAAGLADVGRGAAWFPVIGLGIGALLVVGEWVTAHLFPAILSALLVVTIWKLASGGLHLDGLADCVDGLGGRDAHHRLAIMRDSRIGTFGAVGLILVLLLEIAAVAELTAGLGSRALLAAPAVGRAMPVLLGRLFPPARADGQGARFQASLGRLVAPVALLVAVAASTLVLGAVGIVACAVAAVVSVAFGRFMSTRLGGITGDVLGASVELAELAVLLTVLAWMRPS